MTAVPNRTPWLTEVPRELSYTLRSLLRTPVFTCATIATLGIGIGAATTIYSVVDTVLLRPLPFPDGDRLVRIVENERPRTMQALNYSEYLEWRARTTTLTGLATATLNPQVMVPMPQGVIRLTGGLISTNYFEVLGAKAMLGRTILSTDEANPDVVVLSILAWRRYFAADPAAVGRVVELRGGSLTGRLFTIVGVMPEAMETVGAPLDFFTPIVTVLDARPRILGPLIGRMKPGVSLAAASEEANAIGTAVRPPRPASAPPLTKARFEAGYYKDGVVEQLRPALRVFLIAVAVVLLIVCANVTSLLLARGAARRREMAVRLALGAVPWRIIRLQTIECLMLALLGGALGSAVAASGVVLFRNLATVDAEGVFRIVFSDNSLPRAHEVSVNLRLLVTAFAIAAISSVLFGILPALRLTRANYLHVMSRRGVQATRHESRTRTIIVAAQLGLATVLLVGAGLLTNSFIKLATVDKGYDPDHVLAFQLVVPSEYSTSRKAELIESVLSRLRAMPNTEFAGFAYAGILLGVQDTVGSFVPPNHTLAEILKESDRPRLKAVSRGYLAAAKVPLLDGREFDGRDSESATPVAVISRIVARRYFGLGSPVGATLTWHCGKGDPVQVAIVGVVEDVRQASVERPPYPEVFMDYRQVLAIQKACGATTQQQEGLAFGFFSFAMRTENDPMASVPSVRQAVNSIDPSVGIDAVMPMDRLVGHSVARQRLYATMLGLFAAIAGLLAAVGLYGMLAYTVVQRTREFGIRMAIGATRRDVLVSVLRDGLAIAGLGIGVGLAVAAAGAHYLQSLLFGITPLDGRTFAVVTIGFTFVVLLASYVPSRRATGVDPAVALRDE